jgi:hypothetical protein
VIRFVKHIALVMIVLAATGGAYGAEFNITTSNDSGAGSLRWAIEQANISPGGDAIYGNYTAIQLTSPLPAITGGVYMSHVTLEGGGAGPGDGLVFDSEYDSIYDVHVNNFKGDGIVIRGGAHLALVSATGNQNGLRIEGRYSFIEATTATLNTANGIWITNTGSGNQLGTHDPDFCFGLGDGCYIPIGGGVWAGGNGASGVRIDGMGNTLTNAHIGLEPPLNFGLPNRALRNAGDGVVVIGAHNIVMSSTVSNSHGYGLLLLAPAILESNAGSCNTGGFIEGSLIAPPRIAFARADPTAITIAGDFQGTPNARYDIGLSAATTACPDLGLRALGATRVTTDGTGYASWTTTLATYGTVSNVAAIATRGDAEISRQSVVAAFATGDPRADLAVQTMAPPTAQANDIIDFVTTVRNIGPAAVDGFIVGIPRMPGTALLSATATSGQCYLGGLQQCYIGTVAVGESVTISKRVRVLATTGTLHHLATATHYDSTSTQPRSDPNPANNTSTVDVRIITPRQRAAGR